MDWYSHSGGASRNTRILGKTRPETFEAIAGNGGKVGSALVCNLTLGTDIRLQYCLLAMV